MPATDVATAVRGQVVAVVLTYRGRVCLLRRSKTVSSDQGRWHCVTGFLPRHTTPSAQALVEVFEETGLNRSDLRSFEAGSVLRLPDSRGGDWVVHSYRCEVVRPDLRLNWENDGIRWVSPAQVADLPIVDWLPEVTVAVGAGYNGGSDSWDV